MKYKQYLAGYTVFVAGILTSILFGLLIDSAHYSELGLEGTILIGILGGILPYFVGIIWILLANLFVSKINLTYPGRNFFLWAAVTGFLSGVFGFELMQIAFFTHYQLVGIILVPSVTSILYFLIRIMREKI